ncbi:Bax inhibitor-1/YccA family protein [Lentilactobacillus parabuchneri]|uniref:Bax inhibitor-1/YccA family protein n=1 Tax=Lentilactobacillus parabuchneri TaxID=152331 RepID=UPI000A117491|nr:Bax inhibitor-1/YccA family protein [Lentilactobacillus parabuchneri]ORN06800.1 Inner membrane protein YbhL [Lentilactobacillus parabuchneri]ORN21084.1 Inner membrane protein YbhL [Lentilactobacillus parabuchneri]
MNNYPNEQQEARRVVNNAAGLNAFLTRMYGWMSLAVLVSAATAFLVTGSVTGGMATYIATHQGIMWIGMILWFVMPFVVSMQALKRPTLAFTVLMLYAILSGFVFATIAWAYTGASIAAAFVSASAIFITMTTIGLVTHKNLDRIGAQASAALIALIIAMIINMFLRSSAIAFVFSIIAVLIFTVLTAYDTQKMKQMYNQYSGSGQISMNGLAVFGALQLYLDFVNQFLQLLSIFGNSSDR